MAAAAASSTSPSPALSAPGTAVTSATVAHVPAGTPRPGAGDRVARQEPEHAGDQLHRHGRSEHRPRDPRVLLGRYPRQLQTGEADGGHRPIAGSPAAAACRSGADGYGQRWGSSRQSAGGAAMAWALPEHRGDKPRCRSDGAGQGSDAPTGSVRKGCRRSGRVGVGRGGGSAVYCNVEGRCSRVGVGYGTWWLGVHPGQMQFDPLGAGRGGCGHIPVRVGHRRHLGVGRVRTGPHGEVSGRAYRTPVGRDGGRRG